MEVRVEWMKEMEVVNIKAKTEKLNYIMSKVPGKFKILSHLSLL